MSSPDIAFLDRDGTIIRDLKYISDPDAVELIDGAAAAIGRLNAAGVQVVIVSNQSGIGRGYYDVEDYERVHARMLDLLAANGAHIDASYYCPHAPDRVPPCECRKPRAGLFEKALADAGADALKAWYETMAPCWLAIQPALRRRLVLQTHVWLADLALADPVDGPGQAVRDLGSRGSLARALERLVPRREAAAWRRWIDHVCADLARTLGRPPQLRTQAWARWLFFIPYSVPAPRRVPRRSPRLPAVTWTAKPWREKMNV